MDNKRRIDDTVADVLPIQLLQIVYITLILLRPKSSFPSIQPCHYPTQLASNKLYWMSVTDSGANRIVRMRKAMSKAL